MPRKHFSICDRCKKILTRKNGEPFSSQASAWQSARNEGWRCGKNIVCPECQTDVEKTKYTKNQFMRDVANNHDMIPDFIKVFTGSDWHYGEWIYKHHRKIFDRYYFEAIKRS